MRFSLRSELVYRFPEAAEVLLLIEAAETGRQKVLSERLSIPRAPDLVRATDPVSGERRAIFTAEGEVAIRYEAEVEVAPPAPLRDGLAIARIRDLPPEVLPYLRPSRYCPSDRFERLARRKFGGLDGGAKVAAILAWVGEHLDYEIGSSHVSTSAMDTFTDAAGVCRDFAHLAATLCRAADIPARTVSAYAWKLEPPDLHAVVEVWLEGEWRLADPTRLAPVEGLVRVASGHDAADVAFMSIFGKAELVNQSFAIEASANEPGEQPAPQAA